jgi:hypothetical protein
VETPSVGVVVLSQHADEDYALELLCNGTAGLACLLKDRVDDTRSCCVRPARSTPATR